MLWRNYIYFEMYYLEYCYKTVVSRGGEWRGDKIKLTLFKKKSYLWLDNLNIIIHISSIFEANRMSTYISYKWNLLQDYGIDGVLPPLIRIGMLVPLEQSPVWRRVEVYKKTLSGSIFRLISDFSIFFCR